MITDKSCVVFQFTMVSCVACYIGETNRHFNTSVNDKNPHLFKHLRASRGCRDKCDISCFKILDHASTYSQLEIKESTGLTIGYAVKQLNRKTNK